MGNEWDGKNNNSANIVQFIQKYLFKAALGPRRPQVHIAQAH